MNKGNLVPGISKSISFYPFTNNSSIIHETVNDHRIEVSNEFLGLLKLVDGIKNIDQIRSEYDNSLSSDFIYTILYEKLGRYGIITSDFIDVKKKEKPGYLKCGSLDLI